MAVTALGSSEGGLGQHSEGGLFGGWFGEVGCKSSSNVCALHVQRCLLRSPWAHSLGKEPNWDATDKLIKCRAQGESPSTWKPMALTSLARRRVIILLDCLKARVEELDPNLTNLEQVLPP